MNSSQLYIEGHLGLVSEIDNFDGDSSDENLH